jgi:cell division protein FtsB
MAVNNTTRRGNTAARRVAIRVGLAVGALLVVFFALEGGEYGTRDLLSRTSRRAALELEVQQLQLVVDSLKRETRAVETDVGTLERIAREEYGMVKGDRELLYRFADDLEADGDTVR